MPWIGKTNLLVLGSWIIDQNILALEVDGFSVVKYRPDDFRVEHLLALVTGLVHVL